jgi:GNAT superfamily N-acetyltransferase
MNSSMQVTLRAAKPDDFLFAFEVKRKALGPHISVQWTWDEQFQEAIHRTRWNERPWSIIQLAGLAIGTVSVEEKADHIRFGEFYLLPEYQRQGIGSRLLSSVLEMADAQALPVKLEYLKWNPVGSLYLRHGFRLVSQNDIHFFMLREPNARPDKALTID